MHPRHSLLPVGRWMIPLILCAGLSLAGVSRGEDVGADWQRLEPGLDIRTFHASYPGSELGAAIQVLRIDPDHFELRLLNASAPEQGRPWTAREWCERDDLVAAINGSMYQADLRSSVSLMRTRSHVNNPRLSKDNTVLAFDARHDSLPPVQIIDRRCQDLDALKSGYGTLVQSIRMVSCKGRNVWAPQERRWSTAAIGMDHTGSVLFIHVRSPVSTHDLINILLELPIDLHNAMYAEGGPEAQLYVSSGTRQLEFIGSYESSFNANSTITIAMRVPNVVGVVRRDDASHRDD